MRAALAGFCLVVLAFAGTSGVALADDTKNLGAQPSRDQLIEILAPHGGSASTERGLRVKSANPAAAAAAEDRNDASDKSAPSVALDIKFALDSAVLTDQAKDTIGRLGSAMQSDQLGSYRFRVEGHTDASGQPDHNLTLSQRRAEAVRDYLVDNFHVASNRLDVVGRGENDPIDPSNPKSAANRRVKIVNLGQ